MPYLCLIGRRIFAVFVEEPISDWFPMWSSKADLIGCRFLGYVIVAEVDQSRYFFGFPRRN